MSGTTASVLQPGGVDRECGCVFRWNIPSAVRRPCGTNCCPSRGREPWWRVSEWHRSTTCPGQNHTLQPLTLTQQSGQTPHLRPRNSRRCYGSVWFRLFSLEVRMAGIGRNILQILAKKLAKSNQPHILYFGTNTHTSYTEF